MSLEEKVAQAQKDLEKRDSKGKFRKETWREKFGFWRIMWIFGWGIALGASYMYVWTQFPDMLESKTVIIINNAEAKTVEAPQTQELGRQEVDSVELIADTIWTLESSRGVNNYSKCAALGKVNGIGYGIHGGKWQCFDSHKDEMATLYSWIKDKQEQGLTENELMCLYSGGNYEICK